MKYYAYQLTVSKTGTLRLVGVGKSYSCAFLNAVDELESKGEIPINIAVKSKTMMKKLFNF